KARKTGRKKNAHARCVGVFESHESYLLGGGGGKPSLGISSSTLALPPAAPFFLPPSFWMCFSTGGAVPLGLPESPPPQPAEARTKRESATIEQPKRRNMIAPGSKLLERYPRARQPAHEDLPCISPLRRD